MRWFLTDISGHTGLSWRWINSTFNSEICLGRLSRWNNCERLGETFPRHVSLAWTIFQERAAATASGSRTNHSCCKPAAETVTLDERPQGCQKQRLKGTEGNQELWLCRKEKKGTSGKKWRWWQVSPGRFLSHLTGDSIPHVLRGCLGRFSSHRINA